jgi:hypothetical protein
MIALRNRTSLRRHCRECFNPRVFIMSKSAQSVSAREAAC